MEPESQLAQLCFLHSMTALYSRSDTDTLFFDDHMVTLMSEKGMVLQVKAWTRGRAIKKALKYFYS